MNGPLARRVLAAAGTDIDLDKDAFPFMSWRDGEVAGDPARVARVSFTGELAYEINVPAWHGLGMWEAVMAAGDALGITPYGTESMHVLRAEKGYVIVGQDTDGTVTPQDLGMDVDRREDEARLPRQALVALAQTPRGPDRKQLVGLLPVDREKRASRGHAARRHDPAARTDPDDRPRDVELPQRRRSAARSRSR